ncbi:MAG: TrkA family potassium uptake protein [Sphingobacteriia bacterium]|nr:TrkA family potassium uptake protein [Sphingobacteriia bacterium]NCC39941.1 TrkA family potassium uptake protein [Gammaproteobacteria bacterium]
MRFVFIGSATLAILTSRMLVERGNEVVIIERDAATIERLRDELDVGFIQGDGTRPAILREADPEATDLLFCLTRDDQSNIIASLVARSLGYRRVITKIEDPDLEHICAELGLADSLVPIHMLGRYLADMAEGQDIIAVSDMLRGDTRLFAFRVAPADAVPLQELAIPDTAWVLCVYRHGEELLFADPRLPLEVDDEVFLLTRLRGLKALRQRFG